MAKTQEQIAQFQSSQARSLIREQSRNQHQLNALNNANAATLLLDVSEKLSQEIRPLLEASVSNLLATMSNGRFSSIKLSEEYEITVLDDEKYHELAELSGGEIDLVALALRLALAEVVSSRHGSGGAGFLILDECFASQDQERRSTILSALRNLKASYHQIFLVSHVENMEDYVDQVININLSADRTETEILCS
jgi:exonuclease SbcC